MASSQVRSIALITAVVISCLLVQRGTEAYKMISATTSRQTAATERLERWMATCKALEDSMSKWMHDYKSLDSYLSGTALLKLANFEAYGIETDVDTAVVNKNESVISGDVSIGLTRVCLTTGVGDGGTLFLRAPNYQALLAGLKALSHRTDVEIGGITLFGNGPFPLAKVSNFCLFLRQP